MNKSQVNKKRMIETTLVYLDTNASVWQSVGKIVLANDELTKINNSIEDSSEEQEAAKATIGKTKSALRISIAAKADILNDLVEVYALIEGNDELARKMSDSKSDLQKLTYNDLILRVKAILEQANKYKEVLVADYGMLEEQITLLQSELDKLLEISDSPRAYQVKRSVATQQIDAFFGAADNVLNNQLDKLMSIFRNRDANFYNGYIKARVIVDY